MRIGIGIDTGGTFTDAVAYDFDAEQVLSPARRRPRGKTSPSASGMPWTASRRISCTGPRSFLFQRHSPRTRAWRTRADERGCCSSASIPGWSTGWGVTRFPDAREMFFLDARCNSRGEIVEEPDWNWLLSHAGPWIEGAAAVGIVELDAMDDNAALEKHARELIVSEFGLPTICGHELFSDLDSIKRGASVLLNARLVPLITGFLAAVKSAMERRSVRAPVVIVRSDGSLMSDAFAIHRPVETLLCGPAASVIGGLALAHEKDCLIVDMGGTTTDIAVVKEGSPVKGRGWSQDRAVEHLREGPVRGYLRSWRRQRRAGGRQRPHDAPTHPLDPPVRGGNSVAVRHRTSCTAHPVRRQAPASRARIFLPCARHWQGLGLRRPGARVLPGLESGPLCLVEAAEAAEYRRLQPRRAAPGRGRGRDALRAHADGCHALQGRLQPVRHRGGASRGGVRCILPGDFPR